jgi:hypothetical protein
VSRRSTIFFFALAIIILFFLGGAVIAFSDAIFLSEKTEILLPSEETLVLDGPYYLLSREDMETATLALEAKPILETALDKSEKNVIFYSITVGSGALILGVLVGLVIGLVIR